MSDDTGQVPTTETTQAVETTTESTASTTTGGTTTTQAEETFDRAYVQKLRQEAADARVKLKALEDAEKAKKDAELDELTRTKNALKDAEKAAQEAVSKAKTLAIKSAVVTAATKLGIVDPDAAFKLLPDNALEYDQESGEVKNAEKALQSLVKDKPYLLGSSTSTANPAKGGTNESPLDLKHISGADALWGGKH